MLFAQLVPAKPCTTSGDGRVPGSGSRCGSHASASLQRVMRSCQALLLLLIVTVAWQEAPPSLLNRRTAGDLTALAAELARSGESTAVQEVIALLRQAGHDEKSLARLEKSCGRSLEQPRPSATTTLRVTQKLAKAADGMEAHMAELSRTESIRLAELIISLDDDRAAAQGMLGRVQYEGRWIDENTRELLVRRAEIETMLGRARVLEVPLSVEVSDIGELEQIYGTTGFMTRWGDYEIHSTHSAHRLRRIVRESLRASALSHYLRNGTLEVPRTVGSNVRRLVLLKSRGEYLEFVANARAAGSIEPEQLIDIEERGNFRDTRDFDVNWASSEVSAYTSTVHTLGWHWRWLAYGHNTPPCLSVGHLNWLCLTYFGVGSHDIAVSGRTVTPSKRRYADEEYRLQELKALGRAGITGARTWLIEMVRDGKDPRWESTMQRHMGEIRGLPRLKATFVLEYLQERGEFSALLRQIEQPRSDPSRPRALFEEALGRSLEDFEQEWRKWILPAKPSLRQLLGQGAATDSFTDEARTTLQHLSELRARAFTAEQFPDTWPLKLDADLCSGAEAHGRYLNLHPEQAAGWPAAHEEYPGSEGFTTAGCRAGMHSVIVSGVQSAREAVDAWMGSYFHRLPLLDPGMMRMGLGLDGSVVVLDCMTLCAETQYESIVVWPYDGMQRVPRSFSKELPHPVPGEDQSAWGYPITLQSYGSAIPFAMTLYQGQSTGGTPVDCHFTSPSAPLNVEVAPPDAFCLIPKKTLAPGTTYSVHAVAPGGLEKTWSFTTTR